jgi:ABC-type glycerol-3-phosphate transport system substrate-binding protein
MPTMVDSQKAWPNDTFVAGRLAMVEDGSWMLKDILSRAKFRVGIAPFPAGPVRRVTLTTNDGFGIYSGTRHPEAAWELVKFLISKDYGRAMARASLLQPARASLVDEWAGFVRDQFPIATKEMNLEAFAEGHIKGYSVTAEVAANMSEATRLANDAWDKILTLGQAPAESMKDVSGRIQEAQSAPAGGSTCSTC